MGIHAPRCAAASASSRASAAFFSHARAFLHILSPHYVILFRICTVILICTFPFCGRSKTISKRAHKVPPKCILHIMSLLFVTRQHSQSLQWTPAPPIRLRGGALLVNSSQCVGRNRLRKYFRPVCTASARPSTTTPSPRPQPGLHGFFPGAPPQQELPAPPGSPPLAALRAREILPVGLRLQTPEGSQAPAEGRSWANRRRP
jgi:hypothetical protein